MERCIKEKTFSLNSTSLVLPEMSQLWSSSMASVTYGYCHTLTLPYEIGPDSFNGGYVILYPHLNYRVFIHDPKFYHSVANPLALPRIWLEYRNQNKVPGYYEFVFITVTEHLLLNREEQPCEEEEEYNFLDCVKTSQAKRVGCRPFWDSWSPKDIPVCETVEQLQEHERLDWDLGVSSQKMLVNSTGCNIPCKYKVESARYKVHGTGTRYKVLGAMYKEYWSYDRPSFFYFQPTS